MHFIKKKKLIKNNNSISYEYNYNNKWVENFLFIYLFSL